MQKEMSLEERIERILRGRESCHRDVLQTMLRISERQIKEAGEKLLKEGLISSENNLWKLSRPIHRK